VTTLFNAGNLFTVELSDALGSFAAPSSIGSVAGTGSGSVSCSFPAGITAGLGQAIRVVASDPAEIGEAYVLPITTVVPPNAGLSASLTVCSNDTPFLLWGQLGGTPVTGGSWTAPNGNPVPPSFDPAVDIPGVYSYVVVAAPPCANATAVLAITVVQAANAGADAALTWCASAGPFNLFDQLSGSPQAGGAWTSLGAPHSPVFIPGTDLPGPYVYTVLGSSPCTSAQATLDITIGACLLPPSPPLGIQNLTE